MILLAPAFNRIGRPAPVWEASFFAHRNILRDCSMQGVTLMPRLILKELMIGMTAGSANFITSRRRQSATERLF
jgi:hypothetical protein